MILGFLRGQTPGRLPVTLGEMKTLYLRPESFTDLLPWREYDDAAKACWLEDGLSVGACFELTAVGCEARPADWMRALRDNLQNTLRALPETGDGHWVLQYYLQDEPSLDFLAAELRDYACARARGTPFTEHFLSELAAHLRSVSRPEGLFVDNVITGAPWRGQVRRVRAALYRRRPRRTARGEASPITELEDVVSRYTHALQAAGVGVRRMAGQEFYRWLAAWLNPGLPVEELLAMAPYPEHGNGEAPYGMDLAEQLMLGRPRSDPATGTWWLDGMPHQFVTAQGLRGVPQVGHITAERAMGDHTYALFDRVPEHTIMSLTITVKPQDQIVEHLQRINKKSVGDAPEAMLAREDTEIALRQIAEGNGLYPVELGWYVRAPDAETLRYRVTLLKAKLVANDLQVVDERGDPVALDSWIRNLPMNYDPALDRSAWAARRRSRMMYGRHVANLLPLYGRSTGTGHPGFIFFTRSAEPLTFDPLNGLDRKKNAHLLLLGPTGAGKSATLVGLLMQMLAVHRPRLFLIEAGNSLGLLAEHLRRHGVEVNRVSLTPTARVSLPPFADALRLLETPVDPGAALDEEDETETNAAEDIERRDLLGEMEIAARIMITGGDEREDARMTRADRLGIRKAILEAARAVRESGRDFVLVADVVTALRELAMAEQDARRARLLEMADGMELFCGGLAGEFFNRSGTRWPDADVTVVDLGIVAREGYEDLLVLAFVGLMNSINDLVERHQHDARPTIVLVDEAHIVTTNPLLAPFVVKITKMWRKLGTWLWLATQNLEDFPDAAKKMLNMMEWWLCLVMPKEEVEQIARFRQLTAEQRALLLAARKEPGKYTEGVVLSDQLMALFRVVAPPLCLALAQTEKEEKAERARIMRERKCTELEAAYVVAERIAQSRG